MSSREYAADELRAVLSGMGVTDVLSAARYGSGHINDTFKVDCASGVSYILQRINTDIFDPDAVMSNIRRVTEHIRAKGGNTLEVVAYTRPWRLYAFIKGAHTVDLITEAGQAYKAANAFAGFQDALADLPAPRLIDIIPNFHNTVSRLAQLDAARAADVKGRAASCVPELDFVDARRDEAATIVDLMARGDIPERTTHNDTKINNVMLDDATGEGTHVIDLDTTMPGCALYDFGDMVRTSTANAAEDDTSSSSCAVTSARRSSSTRRSSRTSRSPAGSSPSRSASASSRTTSRGTSTSTRRATTTTSCARARSSRWCGPWRNRPPSTRQSSAPPRAVANQIWRKKT